VTTLVDGCGLVSQDDGGSGGSSGDGGSGGSPVTLDAPACEPIPGENSGATSGSYSIRGRILDAVGVPLVNVPVELSGDAAARHATSLFGTYTLRVDPGDYAVALGDDRCTVDPNAVALTVESESSTQDAASVGGSCTSGEQEHPKPESWFVYVDDPNLVSDVAEIDWRTSIGVTESKSPEEALESLMELSTSGFEPDQTCSLIKGAFVGFESRWLVVMESDLFRYTYRELVTQFVRGAFTIDIRTLRDEYATEEEMQRALVPVRNLSEEDLDALLEGL